MRVVHIVYPCELLLYLQAQDFPALVIGGHRLRIARPGAALVYAVEFDALTVDFDNLFHNQLLCIQSIQRAEHVPELDAGKMPELQGKMSMIKGPSRYARRRRRAPRPNRRNQSCESAAYESAGLMSLRTHANPKFNDGIRLRILKVG